MCKTIAPKQNGNSNKTVVHIQENKVHCVYCVYFYRPNGEIFRSFFARRRKRLERKMQNEQTIPTKRLQVDNMYQKGSNNLHSKDLKGLWEISLLDGIFSSGRVL